MIGPFSTTLIPLSSSSSVDRQVLINVEASAISQDERKFGFIFTKISVHKAFGWRKKKDQGAWIRSPVLSVCLRPPPQFFFAPAATAPHPTPVCSINLDDVTAAIVRQNAHHTPAYWWRGDRLMKPIRIWGLLGGHDGQRSMGDFGQDVGIFNDHRESGPRFNVSPKGSKSVLCDPSERKITNEISLISHRQQWY